MKVVTLRGGKGPKAKYNGARAKLGRRKGGWVSVTTAFVVTGHLGAEDNPIGIEIDDSEDEHVSKLKWRNNAWFEDGPGAPPAASVLEKLPDHLIEHILLFYDLEDMIKVSHALLATCKDFNQRIKGITSSMEIQACLTHLQTGIAQYSVLLSIVTFGFILTELHLTVGFRDLPLLVDLMRDGYLKTTRLSRLTMKTTRNCSDSYAFPAAYVMSHLNRRHPMSHFLLTHPSRAEVAPSFETHVINEFIVAHCPHLTSLWTFVNATNLHEGEHIFRLLPELRSLHITATFPYDWHQAHSLRHPDMASLLNMIATVPNLERLKLSCMHPRSCDDWMRDLSLHSHSVRTVDVTGMGKGFFFRQVSLNPT